MLLLALSGDHREDLPDLRECGRLLVTDKTPVLGVSLNNKFGFPILEQGRVRDPYLAAHYLVVVGGEKILEQPMKGLLLQQDLIFLAFGWFACCLLEVLVVLEEPEDRLTVSGIDDGVQTGRCDVVKPVLGGLLFLGRHELLVGTLLSLL